MTYDVIATGSSGNAVLINGGILIDCGVSYKKLAPYVGGLRLVLLSHAHSDHFKPRTAAALHRERPALRWGCCEWMVKPLLEAGVSPRVIDVMEPTPSGETSRARIYNGLCIVEPFPLTHNVPNCGWYLAHYDAALKREETMFYATDTGTLDNIELPGLDYYFIEANRTEAEFEAAIAVKRAAGLFCYEEAARRNHLSREQAEAWLARNAAPHSQYVFLHQHGGMI